MPTNHCGKEHVRFLRLEQIARHIDGIWFQEGLNERVLPMAGGVAKQPRHLQQDTGIVAAFQQGMGSSTRAQIVFEEKEERIRQRIIVLLCL